MMDAISNDLARHSAEHADMLHQLQELHLKTGEALALLKVVEEYRNGKPIKLLHHSLHDTFLGDEEE